MKIPVRLEVPPARMKSSEEKRGNGRGRRKDQFKD